MSKFKRQIIKERLNNYPWNYYLLKTCNKYITAEIIIDNLDYFNDSLKEAIFKNDLSWNIIKKNSVLLKSAFNHSHKCITWNIIKNNPNFSWHWNEITLNPNITLDIIINNLEYPWDWKAISSHKIISNDLIQNNINLFYEKMDWDLLAKNNFNIDLKIYENFPHLNWNYQYLSMNKNLTFDIVVKHPDKPWNWDILSRHINITFEIIQDNLDKPWNWKIIGFSENITWDIILNNLDKPWNFDLLSQYKNITWKDISANYDLFMQKINLQIFVANNHHDIEIVKNLLYLNWNWTDLSNLKNIEDILLLDEYKDKPWNWSILSRNITFDYVLQHPDKPWDYNNLASNPNITLEIIINNPDYFNGSYDFVSYNPNLTLKIIQDNPHLPWNYQRLSHIVTFDIVKNNLDISWSWNELSLNANMFNIDTSKEEREHMAAFKIQQYWLKAYYTPNYLLCQRRLYNEFKNLIKV
jgi:hypothetical protein